MLTLIVLWWSVFTALTGLIGLATTNGRIGAFHVGWVTITPVAVLIVVRFLFGAGQAGAYPNITRALHNWFPPHERGLAQGAVWMCGRLMGGLTPLVWMVLIDAIGRPLHGQLEDMAAVRLAPRFHTGGGTSGCLERSACCGASSSQPGSATGRKKTARSTKRN